MMLWSVLALMTAAAILAVLWPLSRRNPLPSGSDLAVYRDQLDEIARDRAAGLIGAPEAEAARIEVSRRLLAAADAAPTAKPAAGARFRRRAAALAALIFLPLGAGSLYLALGSPDLPDQPQAARRDDGAGERSLAELVQRVEQHLEQNPDDGRGWEVLGPVYMRLGRYDDAVQARRNALRLLGPSAERETDLGEALSAAANGIVTAEAREAFDRSLALEPDGVRARYFIGLAAEQDGHPDKAAATWRALLDRAPPGAAWAEFVRESLARVDPKAAEEAAAKEAAEANSAAPQPGPSAAEMQAAAGMTAEQRETMVRGMVARLAERLKQDGSDLDGWLRLLRAYMVLGDHDQARAAATDARRALASDPDKLKRLDDAIQGLGFKG